MFGSLLFLAFDLTDVAILDLVDGFDLADATKGIWDMVCLMISYCTMKLYNYIVI